MDRMHQYGEDTDPSGLRSPSYRSHGSSSSIAPAFTVSETATSNGSGDDVTAAG